MSDFSNKEQAHRLAEQHTRLRRRMAEVAVLVATTEEHVADTFEQMAGQRPPREAERLLAQAREARTFAAEERHRAAGYGDDP